jgi:hypothetical protein
MGDVAMRAIGGVMIRAGGAVTMRADDRGPMVY